jgi:outer membrane protein OmpA-like peptidoglycan-associated protein
MKPLFALSSALLVSHILLCASAPTQASASETPARRGRRVAHQPKYTFQTSSQERIEGSEQTGTGLAVYLGAGASYYSVLSQDTTQEANKFGPGFQGRAGLVLTTRSLAFELGTGWVKSVVTSGTQTQVTGTTTQTQSSRVETRAGIVEFSPRLRLGEHFEIGPSAGVLIGTETAFGESTSRDTTTILGGLKAAATWKTDDLHFRLVGQAQSSLFLQGRQVLIGSLGLEIGLPLVGGKTRVRETQVHQIEEREAVEYLETEVQVPVVEKVEVVKEVIREVVLFSFDDQIVHFEFDRAELTPESRRFISRLGSFLAEHPELWASLKVEGHTDNRGTREYNQRLSEGRAAAVVAALESAGVPAGKLESRGMGLSSPLDRGPSDVSYARNRRVELSFSAVTDARALRDGINRIRFETSIPRTCSRGRCR